MLYGTKDVQRELKIGRDLAYALMHSKSFPSFKLGNRFYVTPEAMQKWLDNQAGRTVKV